MSRYLVRPTPEQTTAASMARIMQHLTDVAMDTGVFIATSDRGDRAFSIGAGGHVVDDPAAELRNRKLNDAVRKRFEGTLRTLFPGKGWIRLKGGYRETREGDVTKETFEQSYLIPGVDRQEAKRAALVICRGNGINGLPAKQKLKHQKELEHDYRQDTVFWGNVKAGAYLLDEAGAFNKIGSVFSTEKIGQFFSKWRGYRFAFHSTKDIKLSEKQCDDCGAPLYPGDKFCARCGTKVTAAITGSRLFLLEYQPTCQSDYLQWRSELARAAVRTAFTW